MLCKQKYVCLLPFGYAHICFVSHHTQSTANHPHHAQPQRPPGGTFWWSVLLFHLSEGQETSGSYKNSLLPLFNEGEELGAEGKSSTSHAVTNGTWFHSSLSQQTAGCWLQGPSTATDKRKRWTMSRIQPRAAGDVGRDRAGSWVIIRSKLHPRRWSPRQGLGAQDQAGGVGPQGVIRAIKVYQGSSWSQQLMQDGSLGPLAVLTTGWWVLNMNLSFWPWGSIHEGACLCQ